MDKAINIILGIIAGIVLLIIGASAAVGQLSEFMKEQDKKHRQWIDPRNDRTF